MLNIISYIIIMLALNYWSWKGLLLFGYMKSGYCFQLLEKVNEPHWKHFNLLDRTGKLVCNIL
jgi:hypothetical protein